MPTKRKTPIEEYIDGGKLMTAKERYDLKRRNEGFLRRAYWVHRDDEKAVADFIKGLEGKRRGES